MVSISEKISTALATRLALKLFFSPLRFPMPEREKPVKDWAIKHALQTPKSNFTLYEWPSQGPKILLVHGWSGRGTQFFKLIEALRQKGFHIFAIEAPAHGDSPQRKTHMLEFVDAIEVSTDVFGPFKYAIGHSLGGMAIFNALERNLSLSKIVVIGTPVNIPEVVSDFCKKIHASPKVAHRIIKHIENRYSMKVKDASTDNLAGKFNPQGMIIHDKNDQDVAVKNAQELAKKWPNAQLVITEGLGHRKVLVDQNILDSIVGFLPLT